MISTFQVIIIINIIIIMFNVLLFSWSKFLFPSVGVGMVT